MVTCRRKCNHGWRATVALGCVIGIMSWAGDQLWYIRKQGSLRAAYSVAWESSYLNGDEIAFYNDRDAEFILLSSGVTTTSCCIVLPDRVIDITDIPALPSWLLRMSESRRTYYLVRVRRGSADLVVDVGSCGGRLARRGSQWGVTAEPPHDLYDSIRAREGK